MTPIVDMLILDIPPYVDGKKRRKRLILPKSSLSLEEVMKQPEPMEVSSAQKNERK